MFAVCGRVSAGTPAKPNGADSGTISASFYVLAGDRRTSTAKCVCRGGVCDAYAIVRTVARMFVVFRRASAGTPAKPNGADSGTISASFHVLAGDRRTSTVNRVSRGGVRDADAKVGSAARIFAVFGGVSGGTPVKPRCANSRTISASFDVPAGHRRTSTANLVCRGGVCDADAKVGTAARMFAVFGRVSAGTPAKRKSVNAPTKVAYLDVLDGDRRRSTKNHVSRGERPTAVWVLIAAIIGAPRQTQKEKKMGTWRASPCGFAALPKSPSPSTEPNGGQGTLVGRSNLSVPRRDVVKENRVVGLYDAVESLYVWCPACRRRVADTSFTTSVFRSRRELAESRGASRFRQKPRRNFPVRARTTSVLCRQRSVAQTRGLPKVRYVCGRILGGNFVSRVANSTTSAGLRAT
ncbi:hypothetical protein MRX96_058754 [Rhipicephalus microplus]